MTVEIHDQRLHDRLYDRMKQEDEQFHRVFQHALTTAKVDVILTALSRLHSYVRVTERDLSENSYWVRPVRQWAMDDAVRWGILKVVTYNNRGEPQHGWAAGDVRPETL